METIRMAIYDGREFVESYDVDLDDNIEKHVRWFIGAVEDEGGNRVRITHRSEDGRVLSKWESKTDTFFESFMESLIEELAEERLVSVLDRDENSF